jgi:diguanylate cyclase (GGDEF)-like protein
MAILVLILLIVIMVTFSFSKQGVERQFGQAAQSIAVAASLIISEDMDGYRNFMEERDVTSEYYQRMQNYFSAIKKTGNIRFIYTINRLDDNNIEFILDSEPVGSPDHSAPGDLEEMTNASRHVFMTKQSTMLKPTSSTYGVLLGGNAPIIDENGELLGVITVSLDNSIIFSALWQLFTVLCLICIFLLVLIYFLMSKVSHYFLEAIMRDKLTKAYNKSYFESMLQKSIDVALKEKQNLSILMLDLDHFKNVNDTYGHPFGDVVLAKVADQIRDCLRKNDFLVRYGGEEFIVLLFNLDSSITVVLAERIRSSIESFEIYNQERNIAIKITISIGIANLHNKKIAALEFVDKADKALYKAKETRNAVALLPEGED